VTFVTRHDTSDGHFSVVHNRTHLM